MQARNAKGQTLTEFLADYDENRYRRPSVTVDMAVFTLLQPNQKRPQDYALGVLLVRRGDHPFLHSWALPGGFVDMDEDILAAAKRELQEETGLSGLTFRQFGTFGAPDRDPRTRVITVGHYAVAAFGTLSPRAGDDAADAGLFTIGLKLMAQSAPAEVFRMTLKAGPVTLVNDCARRFDPLGAYAAAPEQPRNAEALASDHGLVLFSALCALEAQPRQRTIGLLAGGNPERMNKARRVLDHLFQDFI